MAASPQPRVEPRSLPTAASDPPAAPLIHSSRRLPELDGLRGIAVAVVVVYHLAFSDVPVPKFFSGLVGAGRLGWSGVDLFFVLSGFLIGGILLDSRHSANYFKTFYLRRAYRILPIYFVLLGLFSLRFLHVGAGALGEFAGSVIPWYAYFTFTHNIWMAVLGTLGAGVVGPTWSLAVEEQFYLSAPFVVRRLRPATLAKALLGVVIAAPVLRTALYLFSARNAVADYVSMPCRADALSLGILAAWLVRTPRGWKFLLDRGGALKGAAGVFFVGMVVMTHWGYFLSGPMVTFGYTWLALFYVSVLLIAVSGASESLGRVLRARVLMQLGAVSYFVYLFHLPLMEAARRILWLRFPRESATVYFAGGCLGIVLTLLAAQLSWRFFEKPLVGRSHRYRY